MHKSHQNSPNSWGIKSKTITKVFKRLMSRRAELWNNKEITTTLTVPGTIRTAVGRKIWNKILGKTSVKKLVNKCHCFKKLSDVQQVWKPMAFFFKHKGYTGVSTGI